MDKNLTISIPEKTITDFFQVFEFVKKIIGRSPTRGSVVKKNTKQRHGVWDKTGDSPAPEPEPALQELKLYQKKANF